MKLRVADRLILLNILPQEGDITTLRILRDLKGRLSFSEDELAALEIKSIDGGTFWKQDADKEVEIEIGQKANGLICDAFRILNEQKKLRADFLPVYERFIKED
jgi:hypothetical protein